MLRVVPPMFKPVSQQIRLLSCVNTRPTCDLTKLRRSDAPGSRHTLAAKVLWACKTRDIYRLILLQTEVLLRANVHNVRVPMHGSS